MTTTPPGKLPHHTTEGVGHAPALRLCPSIGTSTALWDVDLTRYTELTDRALERP
ncbi:hypothetical protein [Streptomyces sp. NPDC029674]|uniref:hypothetical protein n=1 Tax=Streptomyces sp. NPDC029674 TaxID=3365297 RepID=UPI0038511FC0